MPVSPKLSSSGNLRAVTNKFYAPGDQRAARVKDLFAAIAPRYDLINDLQSFGLHRLWKRRLLRLAKGQPGERALDICCGTGDVALALARQGLDVTGLDFSAPMLAVAQRRAEISNPKNIRFLQGDAQNLPFPDASFDIVTISYGLRNLADWETGLREMRRVAAPGARLLVLDFGKPANLLWRGIYFTPTSAASRAPARPASSPATPTRTPIFFANPSPHYAAQAGVDINSAKLQLTRTRIINLMGGIMSINYAEKAEVKAPAGTLFRTLCAASSPSPLVL